MKPSLILTILIVLLILGGVGGLIWISLDSSAAVSTGTTLSHVLEGKSGSRRVRLQLQAVDLHSNFNPVVFDAIDIPKEGQTAPADAPRIRVRYDGHDKIPLERYSHVAVEGTWHAGDGVFRATKMTTQCPSHYEGAGTPPPPPGVPNETLSR